SSLPGADRVVGMLINILPLAIEVPREADLGDWLRAFARELDQVQRDEDLGQDQIREWAGVNVGEPLFDVLHVFDPGARAAPRAAVTSIFAQEIESPPRSG